MKRGFLLLIPLLLLGDLPGVAQDGSGERILDYHSDITVNEDSNLTVTETIKVVAHGYSIKHGIYRDFPTTYKINAFRERVVGFEVVSVLRDGHSEPYHTAALPNGVRVYIGDENTLLPPGRYTYTLTYKTDHQIGFFKNYDQLYWNVTGNGWDFPIEKASATVTLPSEIPSQEVKLEGYTGPQGSKEQAYKAEMRKGKPEFVTIAALAPREGLTIVVNWPKGHVTPPPPIPWYKSLTGGEMSILMGLGLLLVLGYYLVVWSIVGNDPPRGTIMPLYEPPDGLSPAAVRYLKRMGYDNEAFSAAVIDMAVKGCLTIEHQHGTYELHRTRTSGATISADEKVVLDGLLGSDENITLQNTNHTKISGAVNALKDSLKRDYQKPYFTPNSQYLIPGIVLSLLLLVPGVLSSSNENKPVVGFLTVWLSGWTFGVASLIHQVVSAWRGSGRGIVGSMSAGCITLFAIPFFIGEIVVSVILAKMASPFFIPTILLAMVMNYVFYHLLKAPTQTGRELLDRIDGFKMYLGTAERDELSRVDPTMRTIETFEKYLPYAVALGVEQAWARKFTDVIAQAAVSREGGYSPSWYSGPNWSSSNVGGFASALGSSFAGAVSSSSTAPGSSSGSGGGGSSGGGGGGGGGGGW